MSLIFFIENKLVKIIRDSLDALNNEKHCKYGLNFSDAVFTWHDFDKWATRNWKINELKKPQGLRMNRRDVIAFILLLKNHGFEYTSTVILLNLHWLHIKIVFFFFF